MSGVRSSAGGGRRLWSRRVLLAAGVLLGCPVVWASSPVSAQEMCTITGTDGPDVLTGTAAADVICGLGADDTLRGLDGDDVLIGGEGNDHLVGGSGNDVLAGDGGDDVLSGDLGDDELRGGDGDDELRGNAGDDQLRGGDGDDLLRPGSGADVLEGGADTDLADYRDHLAAVTLSIGDGANDGAVGEGDDIGADTEDLRGGDGADSVLGSAGPNRLYGGDGDDQIVGGGGKDFLQGGPGNDTLDGVDDGLLVDRLWCGPGVDTALVDTLDFVALSCENVTQNAAPTDLSLGPATVAESEPVGTTVGVLSVTDPDAGDTHVFSLVAGTGDSDNTSFSMVDTGAGSELQTAAVFDFETQSELSVRLRVTDAAGAFFEEQVTITVTDVVENDDPVAVDDTFAVSEDAAATPFDVLFNDTDPDGGLIRIVSVTQPDDGTVVIHVTGSALTYQPDADYCNEGAPTDDFTYTLNGRSTAEVAVTVTCVDDAPAAVDDTATVTEDDPATTINVLTNDPDADLGPKAIASASDPANGTVVLVGGTPGAHTSLTYQPDPNYCNTPPGTTPDTFTYTVTPGGATATVSVTVTCVADPATVVNSPGPTIYTENAPGAAVDAGVTILNPDTVAVTAASVTVTAGFQSDQDALDWIDNNLADGIAEGASTAQTVALAGNGTSAEYAAALAAVTYANSSDTPSMVTRTATFSITAGAPSSDSIDITIAAVDEPPVAVADSATVLEDAAATAIDVLGNDTDVDAGPKVITAASDPVDGTVVLTGGSAGAHTGLTYQPDANYCNNPPGTTPDTFTYTLNGGSTATVSVTVTCVDDNPVADDDTFAGTNAAVGNTALVVDDPSDGAPAVAGPRKTVSGDILAGDADIDGPGPLVVTAGTFATDDGGSVTIEADGDFVFTPAVGVSCTDTSDFFDYTISDQNPGTPGTDTGRVTIDIVDCVWYVHNNAAGNAGTSTAPFDTLAQAEAASAANHAIFVFDGNNSTFAYGTGVDLKAGQHLIGEAANLVVAGATLHTGVAANRPTITDTDADVVVLDDDNTVAGIDIDPHGAGGGIAGSIGDESGTIDNVNITDTGIAGRQPGLDLDATTGTWNVSDFTVSTTGATGVRLNTAGTVNFAATGTISITTTGATGLHTIGAATNFGTASVIDQITVTGSPVGAVVLNATTGSLTLGDGVGVDLALSTSASTTAAFASSHTGALAVGSDGVDNVSANGGPAVDVTAAAGASLELDHVDSTNSTTDGINVAGLGTGTFSATSGDITGAAGIAFDLDGGNGTVSYPGNIGNGTGASAEITGRSGGTVTLSGPITDTDDAGGGIGLSGNSGGTTTFSHPAMTLNTGAGDAVAFTGSDGHTLNLTGGGLDIDTTSGRGIHANDAGTVTVTGTANTINSTTGTALGVTTTDIAATGLGFQSISTNGAATGIVLDSTGASGGLTVTGNGGTCTSAATCTGGAIQSSTEPGISLTSVGGGVTLTHMSVNNGGDDGISGTSVTGFSLTSAIVSSNGNAVSESGLDFGGGLTGTASIVGSTVSGSPENGLIVTNTSGSLNLTVTASTLNSVSTLSSGNDGILLSANDTASITANISGSTFSDNRGDHFQFATNAASSGTNSVTFTGNTLIGDRGTTHGGTDLGGGVTISPDAAADTAFTISNNNIQGAVDHAILVAVGANSVPAGVTSGSISGNSIGTASVVDSGSAQAAGIAAYADGAGTNTIRIENNHIRQWSGFAGIDMLTRDGSPTLNATITGNTIANPGTFGGNGILATAGAIATDAGTLCATITGNTLTGSGGGGTTDVRLRQRFLTTVRLPGYAGSASDTAAVVAFVQGNNPGVETGSATANFPAGGGGFTGGATPCPTP